MNAMGVDGKMIIRSEYMIFVVSFNDLICLVKKMFISTTTCSTKKKL